MITDVSNCNDTFGERLHHDTFSMKSRAAGFVRIATPSCSETSRTPVVPYDIVRVLGDNRLTSCGIHDASCTNG